MKTTETQNKDQIMNRKQGIVALVVGVAIQLCLGTVYIWSVFQPFVTDLYKWDTLTASITFSIVLSFFVFGSIIGGKIQDKFNPQIVILIGGVILGIGIFAAAFTQASQPVFLYATYGVMGGFGMGMIYTSIISCCQKWFYDKRGLATGLIVAALGFGGVIFAPLAQYLLSTVGLSKTFMIFAALFFIVCVAGSFFIKNPSAAYMEGSKKATGEKIHKKDYTPMEMMRTPAFYAITVCLILATPAYFMISPMIKVIGIERGLSVNATIAAVMIASLLNSAGRLAAPWISDKIGRKTTIFALLVLTATSILAFIFAQSYLILVLVGTISFAYGGYLGIFPVITSDFFGMKNAGVNYGLVLLGFGISAVGTPFLATALNKGGQYYASFIIAAVLTGVCVVVSMFIKAPKRK